MRYRYALSRDFWTFTAAVSDVALPTATDFPASRLAAWMQPSRPWRSASKPAWPNPQVGLTLSRTPPFTAAEDFLLVLLNTNLSRVGVQYDLGDDSTLAWLPNPRATFPVQDDPRDGRRNLLGTVASDMGTLRTEGLRALQVFFASADTAAAYYEIGAVFGIPGTTELGANPRSPTNLRLVQPQQRGGSRDYPEEVNAGPAYLTDEWDVLTDRAAELARWRAFARLGPDDAVLWDYRDGGLYLMRPTRIDIAEGARIHRIRASWRQVV